MGTKEFKDRHRELGLCTDCSCPAAPFYSLCERHINSHREASLAYVTRNRNKKLEYDRNRREKMKRDGRCHCGAPLSDGLKICTNCSSRSYYIETVKGRIIKHEANRKENK